MAGNLFKRPNNNKLLKDFQHFDLIITQTKAYI